MREGQVLAESRQEEIREELARLVESPAFRSSKRCKEFLQYVVDQTVNGANGSLKERSIGIELFGLPSDYDTSQHTIVRVTASETRKKLAQFYQSEGGSNGAVRIDLPPGSYSAEFTWTDAAPAIAEAVPLAIQEDPPSAAPSVTVPKTYSRRWLLGSGAAGGISIAALAAWAWQSSSSKARAASASPSAASTARTGDGPMAAAGAAQPGPVRIGVGSSSAYLDRNGQSWGADRYFTGGQIMARPSERVGRTLDPDLYRRLRVGDFRYDIPLAPGAYELHLHFAETGLSDFISAESSGEGQRVFRVSANGKVLLDFFDIVADAAGTNIATERIFRNISPGEDGLLHLAFSPLRGSAMVNAIELHPLTSAGQGLPLRIRSGWPAAWQDSTGATWRADSYFAGGNALVRRTNPARESAATIPDHTLYSSERWGHFTYALPAADGKYRLTLKFCEGHLGPRNTGVGGVGSRVFDVYCNGAVLLKDFDIVREAGGEGRPIDRTFRRIRPNAQGKILLTFVPTTGMACVNGIEVVDDGDF